MNGVHAISVDIQSSLVDLAKSLGMEMGLYPTDGHSIEEVVRFTGGIGADGVIVTASTPTDELAT